MRDIKWYINNNEHKTQRVKGVFIELAYRIIKTDVQMLQAGCLLAQHSKSGSIEVTKQLKMGKVGEERRIDAECPLQIDKWIE